MACWSQGVITVAGSKPIYHEEGVGGGWHAAKGLVKGDSLWLTTGLRQSILCRYCIQCEAGERRKKSPKNFPNGFSFRYWSAPFYHDLAPPRPYTFLRVYETHKSESCYGVTLSCEQQGSQAGWCNWSFWDGGLHSYFITRIPLQFWAAGKRTDNSCGGKTEEGDPKGWCGLQKSLSSFLISRSGDTL